MFALIPLWGKLVGILAIVGLLTAGYAYWHHSVYTKGYDAAISDVDKANKEGIDEADKQDAKRRTCVSRGGTWDIIDGLCQPAG